MRRLKIFTFIILGGGLFSLAASHASASEGIIELRSSIVQDYRCFASSLMMQDGVYLIAVGCRDLIYPSGSYLMWATPTGGGKPIKLGTLDFGRREFRTREAFSELFVTIETNPGTNSPTGTVAMRGSVQAITFLDRPTTPTPSEEKAAAEETTQEIETKQTSTKEKLVTALKRAGIAAVVALVALVGLIFVIAKVRG